MQIESLLHELADLLFDNPNSDKIIAKGGFFMENPIIVALDDVDRPEKLETLVKSLAPYVGMFKVGLEITNRFGTPFVVNFIHKHGGKVFLDCKFWDIPTTMKLTVSVVASLGVEMFTVHASATLKPMVAAAKAKGNCKMLGVTVLTTDTDEDLREIGEVSTVPQLVERRTLMAHKAGADGIVCSPADLGWLKVNPSTAGIYSQLIKVTTGVRPLGSDVNDQKRVTTPAEAVLAGANYLVVGRAITAASGCAPEQAAKNILREVVDALHDTSGTAC